MYGCYLRGLPEDIWKLFKQLKFLEWEADWWIRWLGSDIDLQNITVGVLQGFYALQV